MIPPFLLSPFAKLIAGALLAAAAVGIYTWWAGVQRDIGREEERAEINRQALAKAEADAKETQRRLDRQGEAQREHEAQLARARGDAVAAAAAADRMSAQLRRFLAAAKLRPAEPAAAGGSPPAGTALDLLAELFSRADSEAGILAEALDRSHAAGQLCVRSYEALKATP